MTSRQVEYSVMHLPLTGLLVCDVPVLPGTPTTMLNGEPIPLEQGRAVSRLRRELRDLREGARLLPALIRETLRPETWARIMDDWTHRTREHLGMPPDPGVEERIAKRDAAEPEER